MADFYGGDFWSWRNLTSYDGTFSDVGALSFGGDTGWLSQNCYQSDAGAIGASVDSSASNTIASQTTLASAVGSLSINGTVTGSVTSDSTSYLYSVSLTAGQLYTFEAAVTSGITSEYLGGAAIDLRNTDGTTRISSTQTTNDADSVAPTFTYTPQVSGTYYLAISAGSSEFGLASFQGGGFQFSITVLQNGATPPSSAVDPFVPYTDQNSGAPTANDVVSAALQYVGKQWAWDDCTGLVWAIGTEVDPSGGGFYQSISSVTAGLSNTIPAVIPDAGYVIPQPGQASGHWNTFQATGTSEANNWNQKVQIGDIVRIPANVLFSGDLGHSFVIVGGSIGSWEVIDNTNPNHISGQTNSDAPITIQEHTFNYPANSLYNEILNASTAYYSRLSTPSAPSISVAWGNNAIADGENSPSSTNGTDFGSVTEGGSPVTRAFTIFNTGNATLTLGSLSLPSGFSVVPGDGLPSSIGAGSSASFEVQLNTGSVGTYSGQISFTDNVTNESPFTFEVTGTVNAPTAAPGISVSSGGNGIADGENSPSSSNGTDFGSVSEGGSPVVRAFTIVNTGTATLSLGSLSLPTGFSVVPGEGLPSSIGAGSSAFFEVQLNTGSVGTYSGQISFTDNVSGENPFTFEVTGTINAPAPPATITANNPTVADGQTVTVSPTVFTVNGSGITEYEVWFSAANQGAPALGSVTENGTAIPLNQGVIETSLSGLNYTGGATAGTDVMWLRAYNGTWSNWTLADITDPGAVAPAMVTANNPTVSDGQTVAVSPNVFTVSGSGITEYEVWFSAGNQGAPALGSVTDNGNAIALNQGVFLTSLTGLNYTGGATTGTDEMWLRAYNGTWSSWAQANITDPGATTPPIVHAVSSISVAENQTIAGPSLIASVSDPSGDLITLDIYKDDGGGSGYFTLNGVRQPDRQWIFPTNPSDVVDYVGGSSPGTDTLEVGVYDYTTNSYVTASTTIAATTVASSPPSLTANNPTVADGTTVAVSPTVFTVSGSGITEYEVWFSAGNQGAPALGSVTDNGNVIALNQGVFLTSLTGLNYTGGATAGTDEMWLRAYNGTWSNWSQANITDPGAVAPVAVTANNPTVGDGQTVAVSPSVFSVSGSGITEYEVWFSAANQGAPALGSVTDNGTAIALNQGVFLTSLNGLNYTGGATAGTDEMWLRAYNGNWSSWTQANITDPGGGSLTVTANNPTVKGGQSVAVSPTVFTVSGSGITDYEVWFSAANQGAPALGSVTDNGAAIALNQGVFLTSLNGLDYTGAAIPGTDEMWLRAYNGSWSGWVQADITGLGAVGAPEVQTSEAVASDGGSTSGWWGGADAGWLSSYVAPFQSAGNAVASSDAFLAAGLQASDPQNMWGAAGPSANLSWSADPATADPFAGVGAPQLTLSDLMAPTNLTEPTAGWGAPAAQLASSEPTGSENSPVIWAAGTAPQHLT